MLPINNDVTRECLKKLHAICADHGALPSSYIIPIELIKLAPDGQRCIDYSCFEGTYRDEKVCVVSTNEHRRNKKVRINYCLSSPRLLMVILGCCRYSQIRSLC